MNKINICLAIDDNYIPPCLVTISSILKNRNLDEFIHFYILSGQLKERSIDFIKEITNLYNNVSLTFIEVDISLFQKYHTETWGLATAYRLKVASIFKNIDKILYLDSDIYVTKSLWDLYNTDITNVYGALVPDIWQETQKRRFPYKKQTYFNAGIFLINIDKWRCDNIEYKLDEYFDKNKNDIIYPDQDPINVVLDGNIVELSYKYNFAFSPIKNECLLSDDYQTASKNPTIIHYIFNKPWRTSIYDTKDDRYVAFYFGEVNSFPAEIRKFCNRYHQTILVKKFRYKLFDRITILKLREYTTCKKWYLFGFLPLLTIYKNK